MVKGRGWLVPDDRWKLRSHFVADCCGDGVGVAAHRFFAFCFDHHARQRLGAAVADDDPAGIVQLLLRRRESPALRQGWNRAVFFSRTFTLTITCGKDLEIGSEFVDGFAGAGDKVEHDERGEQAVAGGGQVGEENVAGLLAAQSSILLLHLFKHVAVADGCAQPCGCRCA